MIVSILIAFSDGIVKMMALVIAMVMVVAMSAPAFAAGSELTPNATDTGRIEITQSATSVTLNGRVFRAYRILDVQSKTDAADGGFDAVAYTVPANTLAFWTDNTKTGLSIDWPAGINKTTPSAQIDNLVTKALANLGEDDSANVKAFAEKAQAWASANLDYYVATGVSDKVTFNNLPFGYYIVDDQTTNPTDGNSVSAVILDTATPVQTIVVKASTVPSDKKITGVDTGETGQTGDTPLTSNLEDNDEDGNNEVADVSIGDTIHFQVDSKVPDTRGYNTYKFVVNDTLDKGLKLDKNSVKIKIGNDEYTAPTDLDVTVDPDPTTGAGTTTLKIVLKSALAKFTKEGVNVGDAITITYNAELTEDAPIGVKVENKVTIDYSNNPKFDYDGTTDDFKDEEPKGTTPEKRTETYTTELTILKVDESGKPLSGAEFTLTGTTAHTVVIYDESYVEDTNGTFWKLADGSYTTEDPTTPNATDASKPKYDLTKYDDYKDGDGLSAAAGYKKYKLQKNTSTKTTVDENTHRNDVKKTTGADGVVTFSGLAEGTYTITETGVPAGYNGIDPITTAITFSYDTTTSTWKFSATNVDADGDNTFSVKIQNNKGTELPSTGGIGTTIFYVVGAILVMGAGILLVTRRKMRA